MYLVLQSHYDNNIYTLIYITQNNPIPNSIQILQKN